MEQKPGTLLRGCTSDHRRRTNARRTNVVAPDTREVQREETVIGKVPLPLPTLTGEREREEREK